MVKLITRTIVVTAPKNGAVSLHARGGAGSPRCSSGTGVRPSGLHIYSKLFGLLTSIGLRISESAQSADQGRDAQWPIGPKYEVWK
jgi:hypothetical protein